MFVLIRKLLIANQKKIKQLSTLVIVNVFISALGFITQVKIANVLGKESFGLISFGIAIATYGAVFIRFGLDKTLVRDLIHYPTRFSGTVKSSLQIRLTFLLLFIVGVLTWKLSTSSNNDISWGVFLIISANVLMTLDLQAIYDSWDKMTRHAMYHLVQKVLYFILVWVVILFDSSFLSVSLIGTMTLIAVLTYLALQYSWAIPRIPTDKVKTNHRLLTINMIRGNTLIWMSGVIGLSFGTLNQIILKYYHGASELGGYSVAWMIVTMATILLSQVSRIGFPATARMTTGESTQHEKFNFLIKYSSFMLCITSPISFVAFVYPEWILSTFFNPEFRDAASALKIMGLYIPVFSIGLVATQYTVSIKQEKAYFYSNLLGGVVSLTLCLILIPTYGSVGAIWALLLSHGLALAGCVLITVLDVLKTEKTITDRSHETTT